MKRVAVIGAGASGMMAAYAAAKNGHSVTVFEKNEKCGKKIYITGKGRCNITHDCDERGFLENVVSNPKFMIGAIYGFSPADTVDFFNENGLKLKCERGGRLFPVSDKSSDVIKTLEAACKNAGVNFKLNEKVLKIGILNSTLSHIISENGEYPFDCAIVCTGGISYPSTGSTGDGYEFARASGHEIIPLKQGLCGLNLKGDFYRDLQGLTLKNVALKVFYGQKLIKSFFGEMLFTHYGVSGPIILSASSLINRLDLSKVKFVLDLKPALSDGQLENRILRDFNANHNKSIANCLKALLPSAMICEMLKRSGISGVKAVNAVTREERGKLLHNVKNFDFYIASLRGFEEAIITCGGVNVKQIDPKTMESKLVKGLYFCGEVLDLDAFTGGYNLQIAFSTGYAAGNGIK